MNARGPPDDRDLATLLRFGVVPVDKPPGPSAHQVSGWVRDAVDDALASLDAEPAGRAAHAGTLDPKVTGCLPVLLGDATRLAPALGGVKEYVAVLELHGPAPDDLRAVVEEFEAPLYQKPPRKSAVVRRLRVREVYDLDVLEVEERRALLRIRCAAGTYVRKLCHDLGLALGTGAHMGDLRRTAAEPFDDRRLVDLHELVDALAFAVEGDESLLREVVAPAERALVRLPRVTIAPSAAEQVAHGAPVYAPGVLDVAGPADPTDWTVDDPAAVPRDGAGWWADVEPTGEADAGGGADVDGEASVDEVADDGAATAVEDGSLVACYTPDGAAVCLGRLVGDPDAERGEVVSLERVLV